MGPGTIGRDHSGSGIRAMYPNLKLQLWRSGFRQNRLAQLLGIHETLLSKIVNGFREPTPELRGKIASLLGSDPAWLFMTEVQRRDLQTNEAAQAAPTNTPS
jgi:transcriptional regulator with XRE-family HTH domain